jgi:NAD+ synthase (glutamine-hydrolysing)
MKIGLAQQNYMIGDFRGNFEKMQAAIIQAKAEKADLIVFSELSVCGYPPRDFLEFKHFIHQCEQVVMQLAAVAGNDVAVLVGAPSVNPVRDGKDLYNSAFLLENGQVKFTAHKTLLPTYDVFDEYRYFEPNHDFEVIEFKGKKLAVPFAKISGTPA